VATTLSPPGWLAAVEEAYAARAAGVVLTRNTSDRLWTGIEGAEASFLRLLLARHFREKGLAVGAFARASGFQLLDPPGQPAIGASAFRGVPLGLADPGLTLEALGSILRRPDPAVAVLLDYADHLCPTSSAGAAGLSPTQSDAVQVVHGWAQDDAVRNSRNFVVVISYEDAIHPLLTRESGFRSIAIPLPDEHERYAFLEHLMRVRSQGWEEAIGAIEPGYDIAELSRHAAGLRQSDLEWLFRRAAVRGVPVSRSDLRQEKGAAIRQLSGDLLEVVEPDAGFEVVAGAMHAKRFFASVLPSWRARSASCPQGVLLAGVPGCGKSHLVKAVAKEFDAPLVVMRNVRGPFVGESERNLERVLWIIEQLSPCVLWTDEVDQAVGARGTGSSVDGGTSERMLGRLFEYFGSMDKRGRVLWIGTTNRPDLLDVALLDRFQVVLPWIHPTATERAELLPMLAAQVGRVLGPDVDPSRAVRHPALRTLTARSMQEILVAAGREADARAGMPGAVIGAGALAAAIEDHHSILDPVEHEFLALKALSMTSFRSLLPWQASELAADLPDYLGPVLEPGTVRLDHEKLRSRLHTLEDTRIMRRERR
jgi:hypothetical protein